MKADDVFAQWHFGAEDMSVAVYPDGTGFNMTVSHNWVDGKKRPLSRQWRTKVLRQLGFRVLRWDRTEWGEQAVFYGGFDAREARRNLGIDKPKA